MKKHSSPDKIGRLHAADEVLIEICLLLIEISLQMEKTVIIDKRLRHDH